MDFKENKQVFVGNTGVVTYGDICSALKSVDAGECDVLFVHSGISFGKLADGINRTEVKELLLSALEELGVKTLIFPTFTFSFCNKEDFDVQKSRSSMGMLPEYVRSRPGVYRTDDPIMSVAIIGDRTGFEHMTGISSCGEGGIFHQLHISGKKVKFLFLGTSVTKCFTFLHYVEEVMKVPYRYGREFRGKVIKDDQIEDKTVSVYVRYKGVVATLPKGFEEGLLNKGIEKKVFLGDSSISIVNEEEAFTYIVDLIKENQYVFSILPENGKLIKEYEYGNVTTM